MPYSEELTAAQRDPATWLANNRELIQRSLRRPMVRLVINRHPELNNELGQLVIGSIAAGKPVALSPEQRDRLHHWIQRALPVLKIVATFTPVPWNLGIIGLIVLLILIDQRLVPVESV